MPSTPRRDRAVCPYAGDLHGCLYWVGPRSDSATCPSPACRSEYASVTRHARRARAAGVRAPFLADNATAVAVARDTGISFVNQPRSRTAPIPRGTMEHAPLYYDAAHALYPSVVPPLLVTRGERLSAARLPRTVTLFDPERLEEERAYQEQLRAPAVLAYRARVAAIRRELDAGTYVAPSVTVSFDVWRKAQIEDFHSRRDRHRARREQRAAWLDEHEHLRAAEWTMAYKRALSSRECRSAGRVRKATVPVDADPRESERLRDLADRQDRAAVPFDTDYKSPQRLAREEYARSVGLDLRGF